MGSDIIVALWHDRGVRTEGVTHTYTDTADESANKKLENTPFLFLDPNQAPPPAEARKGATPLLSDYTAVLSSTELTIADKRQEILRTSIAILPIDWIHAVVQSCGIQVIFTKTTPEQAATELPTLSKKMSGFVRLTIQSTTPTSNDQKSYGTNWSGLHPAHPYPKIPLPLTQKPTLKTLYEANWLNDTHLTLPVPVTIGTSQQIHSGYCTPDATSHEKTKLPLREALRNPCPKCGYNPHGELTELPYFDGRIDLETIAELASNYHPLSDASAWPLHDLAITLRDEATIKSSTTYTKDPDLAALSHLAAWELHTSATRALTAPAITNSSILPRALVLNLWPDVAASFTTTLNESLQGLGDATTAAIRAGVDVPRHLSTFAPHLQIDQPTLESILHPMLTWLDDRFKDLLGPFHIAIAEHSPQRLQPLVWLTGACFGWAQEGKREGLAVFCPEPVLDKLQKAADLENVGSLCLGEDGETIKEVLARINHSYLSSYEIQDLLTKQREVTKRFVPGQPLGWRDFHLSEVSL